MDKPMNPEESLLVTYPEGHRSGFVALIGKPNAGKSTLMNALVGRKLSIVSKRPQTTRHRILGILTGEGYQALFLDTPGVIKPRYRLQESMMRSLTGAVEDADVQLLLVDVSRRDTDERLLEVLTRQPAILVLNKIDLVDQDEALPIAAFYAERRAFEEVIPISALAGTNVGKLKDLIVQRLPEGPPFYPPDMISEHPERFFVAEIIREKIFELFREEIPYATQVNVVTFEERTEGKDFIDAEIVIESESQKPILIGKKGAGIKQIGSLARPDIEAFLGRPVFLQLHVKVRKDWRRRDTFLRSYGY